MWWKRISLELFVFLSVSSFLRYLCRVVHSCAATTRCERFFLGLREGHKYRRFHIAAFLFFSFFFLGLQGQHIILCASGNSSKSSGIYILFRSTFSPFAAVLFTGFSGFTASRLVLRYVYYRLSRTKYDLQVYRCVV